MGQYKYYTQGFIKEGVDFSKIFAEKQAKMGVTRSVAYSLPDVVEFLKTQSQDFAKQDQYLIDLDFAIYRLVKQYRDVTEKQKDELAENMEVKTPYEVGAGMTPIQRARPAHEEKPKAKEEVVEEIVTETAPEEIIVAPVAPVVDDVAEKRKVLEASISSLEELLEDAPGDATLIASIDAYKELLEDLNNEKFAKGGGVGDGVNASFFKNYSSYLEFVNGEIKRIKDEVKNFSPEKKKIWLRATDQFNNSVERAVNWNWDDKTVAETLNWEYGKYGTEFKPSDINSRHFELGKLIVIRDSARKYPEFWEDAEFEAEERATNSYAKGGEVDLTPVNIASFKKNIMGTVSFDMQLPNMRKQQDFSVYPIHFDSLSVTPNKLITIQSDTRIGKIDLDSGRGLMSQSHSSGAYFHHLSFDKKTPFVLSESSLATLREKIKETAGSSVGTAGVSTDNSGAALFANGGAVDNDSYVVKDGEDTWYLKFIDPTHFYLSNSREHQGNAYHIGEFRSRPFYSEIKSWLKSRNDEYNRIADALEPVTEYFFPQKDKVPQEAAMKRKFELQAQGYDVSLKKDKGVESYQLIVKKKYATGGEVQKPVFVNSDVKILDWSIDDYGNYIKLKTSDGLEETYTVDEDIENELDFHGSDDTRDGYTWAYSPDQSKRVRVKFYSMSGNPDDADWVDGEVLEKEGVQVKTNEETVLVFYVKDLNGKVVGMAHGNEKEKSLSNAQKILYNILKGKGSIASKQVLIKDLRSGKVQHENIKDYSIGLGNTTATYAKGGGVVDSSKVGVAKRLKIKNWYKKTYPTDDLGEQIKDDITFWSLWGYMAQGYDVYDVLGVGDSAIRERVFEKLSEILGVGYDIVYNKWLSSNKGGGVKQKGTPDTFEKGGGMANEHIVAIKVNDEFAKFLKSAQGSKAVILLLEGIDKNTSATSEFQHDENSFWLHFPKSISSIARQKAVMDAKNIIGRKYVVDSQNI